MRRPGRGALLLLALGLAAPLGCGQRSASVLPELEPPDLELGAVPPEKQKDLYMRLCSSCHGREGRGDGPLADELRVPPADLTRLSATHDGDFPRVLVEESLTGKRDIRAHGPGEMPVWAERFAPSESPAAAAAGLHRARLLTALVDYVEALQRPQ